MSPARAPYDAPNHVVDFYLAFRSAHVPAVRWPIRVNKAEERGGGASGYKCHLHISGFSDIKSGFEFDFWPDDLGLPESKDGAAIGLYLTNEPFRRGLLEDARALVLAAPLRAALNSLGFEPNSARIQNRRDETTGGWVVRQVVPLHYSVDEARKYGVLLAKLMNELRTPLVELVQRRAPELLKARA